MSIGKKIKHDSAYSHVTGESIFIDDRSQLFQELHVEYLGSPVAHGLLKNIDLTKANQHPDVEIILTSKDIYYNRWGTVVKDQPLLVDIGGEISHFDEPLCLIASAHKDSLAAIKKLIEVEIETLPPIFTIDEAITSKMFLYEAHPFERGQVDEEYNNALHKLSGFFECGGQDHFYLESQASIVYPLENGHLEVHSSSQHPTETQHVVALATGLKFHQVTCIVKRMGGGFGGKESQAAPFAAYAALVAQKTGRPARIVLTKDDDMMVTGKRHPFKNFYEIGFDDEGKILAFKVHLYSDAGAYLDLSSSIIERAMFHVDGAYYLPHVRIEATCCKTHHHSHTAFRGFGGPQGNMTIESIIEDMAAYLGIDALTIRQRNSYQVEDRNITPYEQKVENNLLPRLFSTLAESCDYKRRRESINKFNQKNHNNGRKLIKGISLTATKFGIAFTAKFLNQGNALVNLHTDGTIQVSTGATEMGQGVNTKIAQIVAHAFSIPVSDIVVMPTSTEKNHNTSPTAASSGTDINGAAALSAAEKIKERLKILMTKLSEDTSFMMSLDHHNPFEGYHDLHDYEVHGSNITHKKNDHIIFEAGKVIDTKAKKQMLLVDLIKIAYLNRISLGEYAHYKTPSIGFDKKKIDGKAFLYFTQGVACSEVLIDEYTGEMKVLQTDILMDLGRPLNPGIDYGQVTGAFIQGQGWVTTEKLFYNKEGKLLSHSPTTYKIPSIHDVPRVFNVNFIENHGNDQNIFGSKAVGEPPFLLGSSVWTAVKDALSYRQREGNNKIVSLKSPATNEEILLQLNTK